jgi:hypothetical protein
LTIVPGRLDDERRINARVAGPGALLVSKLFKLSDRQDSATRLDDKDALDVFRLLQGIPAADMASRVRRVAENDLSASTGERGIDLLSQMFARPGSQGSQMAARAVVGVDDPAFVAASCAALTVEVLEIISGM